MSIILSFFRRIKSRYADDKAVDDFERVARDKGLLPPPDPIDELGALIAKNDPTPEDLERIGRLLHGE